MKTNYIFIRKESSPNYQSKRIVMNILNSICKSVEESAFEYEYNNNTYQLSFDINHQKNLDQTFLTVIINGKSLKKAEVLDNIRSSINKDIRRRNFYLITSYDDSSQLFCEKLYPLFSEYERLLRNVVYNIVTEQFGYDWLNNTFTTNLMNDIKRFEKRNSLIESALYELTLNQLGDYLFTPFCILDTNNTIDDIFPDKEIEKMDKTVLINKIKECKTRVSIWDKFFNDSINLNKDLFKKIQKKRNVVMHSKIIDYKEYLETRELLKNTIRALKKQLGNNINSYLEQVINPAFAEALTRMTQQLLASVDFTKLSRMMAKSIQPVIEPSVQALSKSIEQSLNATRAVAKNNVSGVKVLPTVTLPTIKKKQ